jgi:hypothetical protein
VGEEGLKLLQYCSWENPQFSQALLTELLWHCGFAYWHDMRHHTDLLLHILLIEDSWQHHRIHNALIGETRSCKLMQQSTDKIPLSIVKGFPEDREGLLETIQRNRMNYQKRAYQCIKCLVHLFRKSSIALNMLHGNPTISGAWSAAVEWLHDELERQRGVANQYNYTSWSPPTQSNDNTNSFILERSQSAKNILQMAFELCPDEVSSFSSIMSSFYLRFLLSLLHFMQDQEETNDSEIETNDEYQQQSNVKICKETANENVSNTVDSAENGPQVANAEEDVNKLGEKIDTMKIISYRTTQVRYK